MSKNEEELKPCPFCGDINKLIIEEDEGVEEERFYVHCWICGALGPACNSKEGARDSWDTSFSPSPPVATVSEEEADELNEMIAGWSKDFDGSLDDLDEIHRAMRNAYQLGRNHVSLPPSTVTDEELASEYGKIQQCVWEEMLNESEKWSNPTPEKMHQLSVEAMHRFRSHLSGVGSMPSEGSEADSKIDVEIQGLIEKWLPNQGQVFYAAATVDIIAYIRSLHPSKGE